MIPTFTVIRYITPLREGGSLPAVVQADDGQLYVLCDDPQAALDDLYHRLVTSPTSGAAPC